MIILKKFLRVEKELYVKHLRNKKYAIKIIKEQNKERAKRYKQEIENVEKLDHPNVIKPSYSSLNVDDKEVFYSIRVSIILIIIVKLNIL